MQFFKPQSESKVDQKPEQTQNEFDRSLAVALLNAAVNAAGLEGTKRTEWAVTDSGIVGKRSEIFREVVGGSIDLGVFGDDLEGPFHPHDRIGEIDNLLGAGAPGGPRGAGFTPAEINQFWKNFNASLTREKFGVMEENVEYGILYRITNQNMLDFLAVLKNDELRPLLSAQKDAVLDAISNKALQGQFRGVAKIIMEYALPEDQTKPPKAP